MNRKRIYEIVELAEDNDKFSKIYDYFMILCIVISLFPLLFKESNSLFDIIDIASVGVFSTDYMLRWLTADFKNKNANKAVAIISYPLTFMALVDLLSILPSISAVNSSLKALRMFRLIKTIKALRVLRVLKFGRYSKNIKIISNVFKKTKNSLITVCALAVGYIFISAMIIFNVEPDSFNSFFDAVYWATVSLTTMGYGDIYPVTTFGRLITMISAFIGIAVVALPASIITAEYMKEIKDKSESD